MADIVERLRGPHPKGFDWSDTVDLFQEAATEIDRLRAALEEIAHSKYCNYENTGGGQYGIGVTDGHRYCALIARAVLEIDSPSNEA